MFNIRKFLKRLVAGAVVISLFATAGCSEDENKKDSPPATKTTTTQHTNTTVPAPKIVKPVPKSSLYEYALHLNDENKIPPMTDEVIAEFEKHAKGVKLAPKDTKAGTPGKFVFNERVQQKGASFYSYRFSGKLPGHHASTFTENGKTYDEQHYYHIDMRVDGKTEKLTFVNVKNMM